LEFFGNHDPEAVVVSKKVLKLFLLLTDRVFKRASKEAPIFYRGI
jgi:hypothetical protein